MKHALKAMIILNVGLLVALVFLLCHRSVGGVSPQSSASRETPPPVSTASPASPATAPAPVPFCWSQLEADDYRVYVKNLRAIGCPEPSVRAIVAADVHAVFARRSAELERQLAALAEVSWPARSGTVDSEPAWRAEMAALPAEEVAKVRELLGFKVVADSAADPASAAPVVDNAVMEPKPAAMPLVFQDIDPKAMALTADQQQVINDVRQTFMKQVGGQDQDPNDPAYLAKWQQAQPQADEMLRFMLGTRFFQDYQMAAVSPPQ